MKSNKNIIRQMTVPKEGCPLHDRIRGEISVLENGQSGFRTWCTLCVNGSGLPRRDATGAEDYSDFTL